MRTPTLDDLDGTWKAGDICTLSPAYLIPGCGMWAKTQIFATVPLGRPITASTAKITALEGNVRQNGNTLIAESSLLSAGYIQTMTLHKDAGLLTFQLRLNSTPSGAEASTAIAFAISKMVIEFG